MGVKFYRCSHFTDEPGGTCGGHMVDNIAELGLYSSHSLAQGYVGYPDLVMMHRRRVSK